MKKIYFRILAICLSLFLTFSLLYKDSIQAEALEWVGVAVGYDTALKFLLGLLGVTVGVGVAEEVDWGTLRENAIQVQLDQGNSQAEVSEWWANVIHGSLDTASDCWDSFKIWVSDLVSSNGQSADLSISSLLQYYSNFFGFTISNGNNFNTPFYASLGAFNGSTLSVTLFTEPGSYSAVYDSDSNMYRIYKDGTRFKGNISYFNVNVSSNSDQSVNIGNANQYISLTLKDSDTLFLQNVVFPNVANTVIDLNSGSSDQTFEALYGNIGDIALNPENADTLGVDVIPLPWENIGVSEDAIQDIIDDAIERVIDGTMSLENYWEYVQNITNTYAYSIENNYLLPNENGEDKKADDKVKENTENGAFVLYGLEKVFPFCIPFDIYAFITLLKADPVAPVIEYPIYNPVTQENEIITIDFSEWESVVVIFRYIFDFLLIIGLLLLARPLVGAGGDS